MLNQSTNLRLNNKAYLRYVTNFLHSAIISGTIFISYALQAGTLPDEVVVFTLQREKISEIAPPAQQAGVPPEIEISEQSGVYKIKAVAVIDAPASLVQSVLTDYTHIHRLNPSIIESEVLKQHADDSVSVRTRVIGCAAYFCEEIDRVERVRILPSGDLHAKIIPELSQLKSGQTLWRIKKLGEYSEVTYHSDMEPDIFIPPVVGKFLVKKSIREEAKISFANLEKISNVLAEREWDENYQPVHNKFVSYDPCITRVENSLSEAY